MKKRKCLDLEILYETLDLTLIGLQAFDMYTYAYFLNELQKNDNDLILIVSIIRLRHQIHYFYKSYNNNEIYNFFNSQTISEDKIKKIIIILVKTLKMKFCEQKLDFICFYFLPEYSLFSTNLKIIILQNLSVFDFWITEYEKRFTFFFEKLITIPCTNELSKIIVNRYLQNSLRYLQFYSNLDLIE